MKSCARSSRRRSFEYLAMNDQQNRKAIENRPVADTVDHIGRQDTPIYEYTEAWWDDAFEGWLCAVSGANPQKKRKEQEDIEETTSDDVSPSEGKTMARKRAKARGKLATLAASKDTQEVRCVHHWEGRFV